jgi:hypothetical protein
LDACCHANDDLDIMVVTTSLKGHSLLKKKLTNDNPVVTVSFDKPTLGFQQLSKQGNHALMKETSLPIA